ncbi:hypothetical protein LTR84_003702 [Exophiala bonariae]|uniref:DUF159 domain protein n=1 Tax=Exophiala bonariae TaxID=1690606 RepID=A0AAV9N9L4_9EURO|nr:hypothetical protein LTR84_003702 [Exophiala bonariae]
MESTSAKFGFKRASFVRYQLQEQGLPVDDAPADDEARETYNFPPGAYGLVYRADVPDQGVRDSSDVSAGAEEVQLQDATVEGEEVSDDSKEQQTSDNAKNNDKSTITHSNDPTERYKYQIKVMKWGLIPFWTKRSPDYSSMLKTINCRDDSLAENRGMWTTMKAKKRCLVVAQGFFEWLKKGPGPKDKVPHFVKRKDGQLMCFAGLWDCVKYEGSEEAEKLYTYTIITTDSNKQLKFLHDRMPVILDPGTDEIKMWLDPSRNKWSKELQAMLKPFEGELECYPVDRDVGKVGNNSPGFIVPVDSKENKKNIANFFGNAAAVSGQKQKAAIKPSEKGLEQEPEETRKTVDHDGSEDNAPLPVPTSPSSQSPQKLTGKKREAPNSPVSSPPTKQAKFGSNISPMKTAASTTPGSGKKPRSATNNKDLVLNSNKNKKKTEAGTQRITNFFGK